MIEGSENQIKLKSDSRGLSRLRLSASVNLKTSSYNEVISYKEKKKQVQVQLMPSCWAPFFFHIRTTVLNLRM